ncbi:hypothetical protein TNCV_301271 [Trichonephila clavipes]|nr:hypothetical protein TNCV_301271 [Trichonephila clavipes]
MLPLKTRGYGGDDACYKPVEIQNPHDGKVWKFGEWCQLEYHPHHLTTILNGSLVPKKANSFQPNPEAKRDYAN